MSSKDPMSELYTRLGSVGFPRKYLREIVLPDWWEDEIGHNPTGYAEGLLVLSRILGLDLASLQNEAVPVGLRNLGACKFKKRATTGDDELAISRSLATRVAELAAPAVPAPTQALLPSASELRRLLLGRGAPWIGLPQLVDYCWSVGLGVYHVAFFPPGAKKMDGLAWKRGAHRAIMLSKNAMQSAWLLFILAHEMGHVAAGHLVEDGVLLDEEIDRNSTDDEERAANAYALELLTGDPECQVFSGTGRASAQGLARAAADAGRHEQIDPGHIVLNFAYQAGGDSFAMANKALQLLEPDANAPGLIREQMLAHLDNTKLPEETYEFILRITNAGEQS